jgi:hypothetical protein
LMDSFPCLVIRGICDYADSHKNVCGTELLLGKCPRPLETAQQKPRRETPDQRDGPEDQPADYVHAQATELFLGTTQVVRRSISAPGNVLPIPETG